MIVVARRRIVATKKVIQNKHGLDLALECQYYELVINIRLRVKLYHRRHQVVHRRLPL